MNIEKGISRYSEGFDQEVRGDTITADRYTSREWLEKEFANLWPKVWHLGAVTAELEEEGDIVRHNHTGLLAPAGDGVAFGHAVARILAEPATRQSMATAAVETVMARHDLSAAAATIGTALEQVRHAGRL